MAGITVVGSASYFYRIRVTEALMAAVVSGSFPSEETIVIRSCPRPGHLRIHGNVALGKLKCHLRML